MLTESQRLVYASALMLVVLIGGGLLVAVWPRRALPGGRVFFSIVVAGMVWALADGFSLLYGQPQWISLAYVGIGALPVAWLAFCLEFTGRGRWFTPAR